MRRPDPARLADPDFRRLCGSSELPTSSRRALTLGTAVLFVLLGVTQSAHAQFGPGGGMRPMGGNGAGGMGGPQGGPPPDKPEGPAEAAPSTGTTDTATEQLPPWPEKKGKELQFLQLNGYLRGRGYYWHNFNLGHYNDTATRANPFSIPYSEIPTSTGERPASSCINRNPGSGCIQRGVLTSDMRLRFDPTLNLSEQIRVKSQIDVFDNLVLGSTPEGFYINGRGGAADGYPTLLNRSQVPQESVVNALQSS
ncbi:MAG TPA: hypothetical protein PK472_14420, partial [Pseudomonadota bacterium]|nr:hypothetical protein [Pseudomonadota bacterium]